MEKIISRHTETNNGRLCPFVHSPYDNCYFTKMKSQDIAMAMFYCYRNFHICGIYRNGENGKNGKEVNQTLILGLKQVSKKLIIGLAIFLFFTALLIKNLFAGTKLFEAACMSDTCAETTSFITTTAIDIWNSIFNRWF